MKKINLSQEQINAYQNMEAMQKYIQASNDTLINSLQEMINEGESVVFKPTDIYPELWESMVNDTIQITRNFEAALTKKIKDLIRTYVLNEAKNPIIEDEEDRDTSDEEGNIAAVPMVFKKRNVKDVEPEDLFENIWKDLINNDECAIYSNLKNVNYIHNQIWDAVKKYDEAGELPREDYTELMNAIADVSNVFVAIDIIWNLFECPYDIFPTIALSKYGYVNNIINAEKSSEETTEASLEEVDEEESDSEVDD